MTFLASTLPSNDGYVAAAYIVFFALLLVYLAIMAIRLSRVESRLRDLHEPTKPTERDEAEAGGRSVTPGGEDREEELV